MEPPQTTGRVANHDAGSQGATTGAAHIDRSLLYVEDDPGNVLLVKRLLESRPEVHLLVAQTGRNVVQIAIEEHPDLILLDRHLPDISGDEVLRRLKASAQTSAIPVVMQSGDSGDVGARGWRDLGASDFLPKPYTRDQFYEIIDRYCQRNP